VVHRPSRRQQRRLRLAARRRISRSRAPSHRSLRPPADPGTAPTIQTTRPAQLAASRCRTRPLPSATPTAAGATGRTRPTIHCRRPGLGCRRVSRTAGSRAALAPLSTPLAMPVPRSGRRELARRARRVQGGRLRSGAVGWRPLLVGRSTHLRSQRRRLGSDSNQLRAAARVPSWISPSRCHALGRRARCSRPPYRPSAHLRQSASSGATRRRTAQ
jgi:hypothetical protein